MRTWPSSINRRSIVLCICVMASLGVSAGQTGAAGGAQKSFGSPEEAAAALIEAVRAEGDKALIEVLGPKAAGIVNSGDPVADAARRTKFAAAYEARNKIEKEGDAKAILVIGPEDYPFPIPLVAADSKWRWDTAAGADEILTRRIGENELAAIEVVRAYVDAQREYAEADRDGDGVHYASRLLSRDGRKDGLHWPAAGEGDQSPLGPLVASAQDQGYRSGAAASAFHGYRYRMLYRQGSHAEGGARNYLVKDRMIGGFGLIATPADYGNSGVMTFIVNDDGVVFQKDFGPNTTKLAAKISAFDPDATWTKVEAP